MLEEQCRTWSPPTCPPLPPASASARCSSGRASCRMPGTHNGMAALQAQAPRASDALYLSGAAMTASMGLPDLGVITVDEVCFFIRQVTRSSGLPVLVDGDTGYGEALNVMHMVRAFEDAGAAAVHIEDQILPEEVRPPEQQEARRSARHGGQGGGGRRRRAATCSSSPAPTGRRARASTAPWPAPSAMVEAGADAIFPEALQQRRDVPRLRQGHARREASSQHDRVRPDAVLHRQPSSRPWATRW